ncbi:myeloid leukemia factor isoform X2 [Drosophila tropicalis]|uniref:myeloid leukemia factor isoform X2 n=1 Tax=Drosophila tropicalis TaxID=46794 RepID=UPI0035AC2535
MSLFGALMGDFDDDLGFMNNHINHQMNAMNMQMRSMNRLMNSFMPDPYQMQAIGSPFDPPGFPQPGALIERSPMGAMPAMNLFGMPVMPNFNRLINADIGAGNGASFCQSTVMTMSSGPDGRPQIYQASTSTKTGPGGVRETRKTVQDSRTGVKKMAIGHHIGERAHIIEKEQDMRSGQLEERQEFINLDEEEAEQFDREFTSRATSGVGGRRNGGRALPAIRAAPEAPASTSTLTIEPLDDDDDDDDCVIQEQQPEVSSVRRPMPSLPPHSSNAAAAATTTTTQNTTTTSPRRTTPNAAAASGTVYDLTNNNNYLGNSRRSYLRNGQYLATPRRPLRTPPSSPLTTISSTSHSIAGPPSIHPHPYAGHGLGRRANHHHQQRIKQQPHSAEDETKSNKRSKK